MIPIKIVITNFLSYRKTVELDFHGIHLACISGANGAGKSSILDAITWSLFGKSRSKSDDDVVNRVAAIRGESAEVQFTFELEGVIYRIIRRKRPAKALILEFQVASVDGQWKSLSEGKIRETQAAIETLLKLNYDTFTNASFLLQGKADEFTTKTPNRRKEILADLLGVNEWDHFKEKATERRKDEDIRLLQADGRLGDIDEELAKRPGRQMALDTAISQLEQANMQLQLLEGRLDDGQQLEVAIKQQQMTVNNLEGSAGRIRQNIDDLQTTQKKREQERKANQILIDNAEAIQEQYLAWQDAESTAQLLQQKADTFNALREQQRPFELAIERARASLEQRQLELENRQRRLESMLLEQKGLQASITEDETSVNQMIARLEEVKKQEKTLQESRNDQQKIEAERALVNQEAGQLRSQHRVLLGFRDEEEIVVKNLSAADIALTSAERELELVAAQNDRLMVATADRDNIRDRQPELKKSMQERKEQIDRLRSESTGLCPLCDQPLSEEHRQSVLERLEIEGQAMGNEYRHNLDKIDILAAEIPVLLAKVKAKENLERNRQAQEQRKATAGARLQEIERIIESWEEEDANRLIELEALLEDQDGQKDLQIKIDNLEQIVAVIPELDQGMQELQAKISTEKARVDEIDRAQSEWTGIDPGEGLEAELKSLIARNAAGDFDPEAQARVAELEGQIAAVAYDADAHERAKLHKNKLAEAQSNYQQLQQAEAAIKPLDDNLKDLEVQLGTLTQTLADLTLQYESTKKQLEIMLTNVPDVTGLESKVYALREEQIAANRLVATSQQNIAVLDELKIQKAQLSDERDGIRLQIQRLRLLEKACGRKGVQALLIERALPEIEDDANELLHRLTGGKMQLLFETQRKLKSSDRLAETLDIRIGDEAGERPYENYSGGEQFRINFAIRLALSKILTRRAGARLQTLVIDEGFGSQDPEGQQRLIEAINVIKQDFERILVITHIDSMRDAFPTHIEVVKEAGGSGISISEG